MGRENLYRMIEALYGELGASPIRAMFGQDLVAGSRKSAAPEEAPVSVPS